MTTTTITAQSILDAVNAGLRAGGDETDWDAPEFAEAVRLTGEAGCVWDFDGWKDVRDLLYLRPAPHMLGGVTLA